MRKKLDVINVNERNIPSQKELTTEEVRRRRQRQRARKLAIKRKKRKRFIKMLTVGAACMLVLLIAGYQLFPFEKESKQWTEVEAAGVSGNDKLDVTGKEELLYEVKFAEFFAQNKPQKFSDIEVYRQLKMLAKEYPELETIYEERNEYPKNLLMSLCNNPELYEYVKGYLAYQNGDTSVAGVPKLSEEEKTQKYPLFLQWDKRWGYEVYGDFNIALSGCGPTTLAMAVVALTGDNTATPDKVAAYSMNNGFYVEGTGTAWSLMTDGCEDFGIKAEEIALDEYVMKNQLDSGKVIICSMRPGDFTSVGHFIMIYGYDDKAFFINDANCIYRSNRTWTYDELKDQIRILWAFERK